MNLPSSQKERQFPARNVKLGTPAVNAEKSFLDNRDPTELGEALLAFKKRYRFKSLSRAYERMMNGRVERRK